MLNKRKKIFVLLTFLLLISVFSPYCSAYDEAGVNTLKEKDLICISYRGDTALYPENSLEAILSAREKGADMVSVGVGKTADGVYVLMENKRLSQVTDATAEFLSQITYEEIENYHLYDNTGTLTSYKMVSLTEALEKTGDFAFILDIDWNEKDGIYDLLSSSGNLERVFIRTKESARVIEEWANTKAEKVNVIGVYDGNIIFNAISHFDKMSALDMPFVQFQSKNYFNVIYGKFFCKRFYENENSPLAIAPMYDLDFSGQRYDNGEGWSEIIEKGYRAIETNNLSAFVSYIDRHSKSEYALESLLEKADAVNVYGYSDVIANNLTDARDYARSLLGEKTASLDELERAYSSLILSMNELNIVSEDDTQKGQLNITPGKIIAVVMVGAVLLAAQIYVHKMQEEKRRK